MPQRRPHAGIVQGQPVSPRKLAFAKQLRREMTTEERMLWDRVRRNRLNGIHFRRQQVIAGYIVDFYCDAARFAIELDGGGHAVDDDAVRDRELSRVGVRVLRIKNRNLREDLELVLERILLEARELSAGACISKT
jgi:very-short-patch-repair endonuclease